MNSSHDAVFSTCDSIIEEYRHLDQPVLAIPLDDGTTLVAGPPVAHVVHSDAAESSGPRRFPLGAIGRGLGWLIIIAILFFGGFASGLYCMDRENQKTIVVLKSTATNDRIELIGAARIQIAAREMMLDQMAEEIARLNGVCQWLQGKFKTSL